MTVANQDIGFNGRNLLILGDDHSIFVPLLATDDAADWIGATTLDYLWLEKDPRDNPAGNPTVLSLSGDSFITVAAVTGGVSVTISIPGTATAGLDPGSYYHRLRLISLSGLSHTPFTGRVRALRRQ
jgi:hypothetical protein